MLEEGEVELSKVKAFIASIDLFAGLSDEVIESMAKTMRLYSYEASEYLINKDKPARFMFLVYRGTVNVALGEKLLSLGEGTVLGEMSLMTGDKSTADVIAESDIEAFIINRPFFNELISKHEELESVMSVLVKKRKSEN